MYKSRIHAAACYEHCEIKNSSSRKHERVQVVLEWRRRFWKMPREELRSIGYEGSKNFVRTLVVETSNTENREMLRLGMNRVAESE